MKKFLVFRVLGIIFFVVGLAGGFAGIGVLFDEHLKGSRLIPSLILFSPAFFWVLSLLFIFMACKSKDKYLKSQEVK